MFKKSLILFLLACCLLGIRVFASGHDGGGHGGETAYQANSTTIDAQLPPDNGRCDPSIDDCGGQPDEDEPGFFASLQNYYSNFSFDAFLLNSDKIKVSNSVTNTESQRADNLHLAGHSLSLNDEVNDDGSVAESDNGGDDGSGSEDDGGGDSSGETAGDDDGGGSGGNPAPPEHDM